LARSKAPDRTGALAPGLNLDTYVGELEDIRNQAASDLCGAGEHALKTLDLFLSNLATQLGYGNESPSMHDSIQFLERLGGRAQSIAAQSERYRATRNALAHNPDLTLRPEASLRIVENVEKIIRSAAQTAFEMARRPLELAPMSEPAEAARDRMLARGFGQLVVVDQRGKLIDLLTYRDIVAAEARRDLDGHDGATTVRDVIATRDFLAVAPVARTWSIERVAEALSDERVAAAVVTENGQIGETPLGIITRGDLLKRR
jgi:CBS domain-containing protein